MAKDALLDRNDSRVTKAEALLKKILLAAGLGRQEWTLYITDGPGKDLAGCFVSFLIMIRNLRRCHRSAWFHGVRHWNSRSNGD